MYQTCKHESYFTASFQLLLGSANRSILTEQKIQRRPPHFVSGDPNYVAHIVRYLCIERWAISS